MTGNKKENKENHIAKVKKKELWEEKMEEVLEVLQAQKVT